MKGIKCNFVMKWVVQCHWVSEKMQVVCEGYRWVCLLTVRWRVNLSRGVANIVLSRSFQVGCEAARRCGQGEKMEDHPRGDSDQRDPVLVYEALELRFLCLSGM